MTADLAIRLAPIILSVLTITLGALVYRLTAEELFHDMRAGRLEALAKFRDNAAARMTALGWGSDLIIGSAEDADQLSHLWRADDEAKLWFGDEVKSAIGDVTDSLRDLAVARAIVKDALDGSEKRAAGEKYREALFGVITSLDTLARVTKPYVDIGTRGLGTFARLAQAVRYMRLPMKVRLSGRWSRRVNQLMGGGKPPGQA